MLSTQTEREPRLMNYHGALLPASYSDPVIEHDAVRNAAGLFDFSFRAKFTAKGSDRVRFLHSMVSNDVKGLTPGSGNYATLLDVRGHILADLYMYCEVDQFVIDTDVDLIEKVLQTLSRYNIGGRVPLDRADLSALSIQGPKARAILQSALAVNLPGPEEFSHTSAELAGQAVKLVKAGSTGEEGYEIWVAGAELETIRNLLLERGMNEGLIPCGCQALELLRIEAGVAEYGAELAEDTLPLEAGLMNALSFNKGCYIGQEIVERARSRGRVNWDLSGLIVEASEAPQAGEKVLNEGKEIGEITSACVSPSLGKTLAMAYLRKEVSEPGTKLALASGPAAFVTALPFYRREMALHRNQL
ncbi:MAG TPA: aminomethyltransferase family protein [Terriglobia bacterium]|nr:aminomethyltransferase family protein [Terriglobia bacterium]